MGWIRVWDVGWQLSRYSRDDTGAGEAVPTTKGQKVPRRNKRRYTTKSESKPYSQYSPPTFLHSGPASPGRLTPSHPGARIPGPRPIPKPHCPVLALSLPGWLRSIPSPDSSLKEKTLAVPFHSALRCVASHAHPRRAVHVHRSGLVFGVSVCLTCPATTKAALALCAADFQSPAPQP